MQFGAIYPQIEFVNDPAAIRDYAQSVEEMGFSHVLAYDHVLGANPDRPEGWKGVYTYEHPFQEPLVLFSFMAAVTQKLGFVTGVIILPQRQTALFAKQAATLDVLSSGRLRVGLGLGWNPIEYTALNQDFHTRGRRIEEQVTVLRKLWTQPLVQFSGRWHTIPDAGLNPLPVQRPIPIWFGGYAEPALKRTARLGDGWLPNRPIPETKPALELLKQYLEEAGRSLSDFGIEARLRYGDGNPETWEQLIKDWQDLGATQLTLDTMRHGFETPGEHIAALRKFAETVGSG